MGSATRCATYRLTFALAALVLAATTASAQPRFVTLPNGGSVPCDHPMAIAAGLPCDAPVSQVLTSPPVEDEYTLVEAYPGYGPLFPVLTRTADTFKAGVCYRLPYQFAVYVRGPQQAANGTTEIVAEVIESSGDPARGQLLRWPLFSPRGVWAETPCVIGGAK